MTLRNVPKRVGSWLWSLPIIKALVTFAVLFSLVIGAVNGVAAVSSMKVEGDEYREVTIKVAAYPGNSSAGIEDVKDYDNLSTVEKQLFMKAVEESDSALEEASMQMDVEKGKNPFHDTKAVRYANTNYPVFVVSNEVKTAATVLNGVTVFGFIFSLAFALFVYSESNRNRRRRRTGGYP